MIKFITIVLFSFSLLMTNIKAQSPDIRLNQLGYFPSGPKKFVVVNSNSTTFKILDNSNQVIFEGDLVDFGTYDASGEAIKIGDFTDLIQEGIYKISVDDKGESYSFEISKDVLKSVAIGSMKAFYYFRASMDLEEKYAGKWARQGGHPDTYCLFHESSGHTSGYLSSPGGWYDAGDYNKYVVNAGITVGTLQSLVEMIPTVLPDNSLNIPESNNGISDILDEIKYELDWLLTMQDSDGGVFFKITTKNFEPFVMPIEATSQRYVVGKSTTSTLDFAAMMAQAYRLWKDIDAQFAAICLDAAEKAWKWAQANPSIAFRNPSDIKTGEYGDRNFKDEFFWAACELYCSTGKQEYKDYVVGNLDMGVDAAAAWPDVSNLGYFTLSLASSDDSIKQVASQLIVEEADILLNKLNQSGYLIPGEPFYWGSNSVIENYAIVLAFAYNITKDKKYLDGVAIINDYIFGRNATGYSFVTGFGKKTPMHPHHRPSGADGIEEPIPGMLVGGPNSGQQDNVNYPSDLPAKSYVDVQESYASNEIAINWNAPLVFVVNFLDVMYNSAKIKTQKYYKKSEIEVNVYPNPFNPVTTISINNIKDYEGVSIKIFDVNGKLIKDFSHINTNQIIFNASNLSNGVYFLKVYSNRNIYSKKLILMK